MENNNSMKNAESYAEGATIRQDNSLKIEKLIIKMCGGEISPEEFNEQIQPHRDPMKLKEMKLNGDG